MYFILFDIRFILYIIFHEYILVHYFNYDYFYCYDQCYGQEGKIEADERNITEASRRIIRNYLFRLIIKRKIFHNILYAYKYLLVNISIIRFLLFLVIIMIMFPIIYDYKIFIIIITIVQFILYLFQILLR